MTCNILVLFCTDSESLAKRLLKTFDGSAINSACISDFTDFHQSANWLERQKSKLHVIFFSPHFLRFLEDKPREAYSLCGQLESDSTVAVFCCGLEQHDILCYHTAPLKSFSSWLKYEIRRDDAVPEELVGRLRLELDHQEGGGDVVVKVVPQFLKRSDPTMFVIFSVPVDTLKGVSVQLHDQKEIPVGAETMNPYVMTFTVPDSHFQFSHNVAVLVQTSSRSLTKQVVHLSQDSPKRLSFVEGPMGAPVDKHMASEEMFLEEQLQFLNGFSGLTRMKGYNLEEESGTGRNLLKFGERYESAEMSQFIGDELSSISEVNETLREPLEEVIHKPPPENINFDDYLLPEMDRSNRLDFFLEEETDLPNPRCASRSFSLPPTLLPATDESYDQYLDMSGAERRVEVKPHQKLLMDWKTSNLNKLQGDSPEINQSLKSNSYISIRWPTQKKFKEPLEGNLRTLLKRGLSQSQQELLDIMQDFKEGECTISNVELQFQEWRERYSAEDQLAKKTAYEKALKTSTFALPFWRPKKKDSKIVHTERFTANGKMQESVSARKISNTSASSGSSRTSEVSGIVLYSQSEKRESLCENPENPITGWVSTYSLNWNKNQCPLYPEDNPPPLPDRPPPSKKETQSVKPVPLPRTHIPVHKSEDSRKPGIMDEVGGNIQGIWGDADFADATASIVDLCHRYGLKELGELFISGTSPSMIPLYSNASQSCFACQDSDGYELPLRPEIKESEENPRIVVLQRSVSLPSDLSQSFEFDDIMMEEQVDVDSLYDDASSSEAYICDNCYSMAESLSSNIYMSLMEMQKDTPSGNVPPLPLGLCSSQQELLELMYAFKRGQKTISQVEQQFQEWHKRHLGVPVDLNVAYTSGGDKCRLEKTRKQSSFALLGLKSFLGKQKKGKTTSNGGRQHEVEQEMRRVKKYSETSNSNQKRLSKISLASSSSVNSDNTEVFRTHKDVGKSSQGLQDAVPPPFPKRRPPMPPKKPPPAEILSGSREKLEPTSFDKPEMSIRTSGGCISKKSKPIPPPKPKFNFNAKTFVDPWIRTHLETTSDTEQQVSKDDDVRRSPSPVYVEANSHRVLRPSWKKTTDARGRQLVLHTDRKGPENSKILGTHRIRSKSGQAPKLQQDVRPGHVMSPLPVVCSEETLHEALNLPPETLKLLKEANLLHLDEASSKFYIRRSRSYPNLKVQQLPKQNAYLELLR